MSQIKARGGDEASNGGVKQLFILNDPPYGSERSYNALRLAISLAKADRQEVRVFLMGDAASCAKAGHKVPPGYYNIADMLSVLVRRGGKLAVCGTCLDARGIGESELVAGAARGTLDQLTEWNSWADKALVF